jgi:hypothetical protein
VRLIRITARVLEARESAYLANAGSYYVFISYSSTDKPVADAVCASLEQKRLRCWIAPRDVLAGQQWAGAILDAIANSRVMVPIYSANANTSPQVIREVDRAVTHNVIIVPFRIEDAKMSKEMEYYIGTAHWLDAMNGPMEAHINKLGGTIKRLLSDEPAETRASSGTSSLPTLTPAPQRSLLGWVFFVQRRADSIALRPIRRVRLSRGIRASTWQRLRRRYLQRQWP